MSSIDHDFPVFADGVILGAGELGQLAQEQQWLHAMHNSFNYAELRTNNDRNRWLFHRYRYLHMRATATSASELFINGVSAGTPAASATDFVVDLGNDYNSFSSNPYGLTLHRPYKVSWDTGTPINLYDIFEFPHNAAAYTFPASNPTFASAASALQLNAISDNTAYMYRSPLGATPAGFTGWGINGQSDTHFSINHLHRYLYVKCYWHPNGTNGTNYDFRVNIYSNAGDNLLFFSPASGENTYTYHFVYDLISNAHVTYNISYGSGLIYDYDHTGLSGWYDIQVRTNNPDGQDGDGVIILLGETPYPDRVLEV